jgi:hypothetical protein
MAAVARAEQRSISLSHSIPKPRHAARRRADLTDMWRQLRVAFGVGAMGASGG